MTPNYANALVQRYMRSSLGGDTSDSVSSGPSARSPSPVTAARGSRASTVTTTIWASGAARSKTVNSTDLMASNAAPTPQRTIKKDSSIAKRASSLIRAADSSSDDESIPRTSSIRPPSSNSFGTNQHRASAMPASREPLKSAAGGQSILHRHSSLTSTETQLQQLRSTASRPSTTSKAYAFSSGTATVQRLSSQGAVAGASESVNAHRQSLVDARAEQLVASYYPHRTSSPTGRTVSPSGRLSQTAGSLETSTHRDNYGGSSQGRQLTASVAHQRALGFAFPGRRNSISPDGQLVNPRRQAREASLGSWQPQQQLQQEQLSMTAPAAPYNTAVQSASAVARASTAAGSDGINSKLSVVPPADFAPAGMYLSPRSSAMQAIQQHMLQRNGRASLSNSESNPDAAGRTASVSQQLRDVTNSAAAAIARVRSTTAAAVALRDRPPSGRASLQQQQAPGIANLGGAGLPPPNTELAREAVERVHSPAPGRRSVSPTRRSLSRAEGRPTPAAAAAEDGSESDSDGVDDSALRGIPGYGDGSRKSKRASSRATQQQQEGEEGRGSAALTRRLSATAEATAEALATATAGLTGRQSSMQLATDPSEVAATVVSKRISAFAAAQAAGDAAAELGASDVTVQQRPGSPSLAGVRQESVAANRARPKTSVAVQQAAAEAWTESDYVQELGRQQQADSAMFGASSRSDSSSSGGSASDAEGGSQGDKIWRQVQRNSGQGWFQSPERLRRGQQQHHTTLAPGRYRSPTHSSRWAPWYEDEQQPQQHRHQSQQRSPGSSMRMHFKLPTAPGAAARASKNSSTAAGAAGPTHSGIQHDSSQGKHKRASRSKHSNGHRVVGDKLYRQLLRESIEQPISLDAELPSGSNMHVAGSFSGSDAEANNKGVSGSEAVLQSLGYAGQHRDGAAADAAADSSPAESDGEPSVVAIKQRRKQRQVGHQQMQQQEQQRRERRKQRRATTAAALQAAFRAASPERRQSVATGRCSPDVVVTAIQAATASAAAAEVARHSQQQQQHSRHPLLQEPMLAHPAAHTGRPAVSSLVTSPQLRKEVAEEALHRARLEQLLSGGTRDVRPSTAGAPRSDPARGRRYTLLAAPNIASPASALGSTTGQISSTTGQLGTTIGADLYSYRASMDWQHRSLSAGKHNVSPPRLSAASPAVHTSSFDFNNWNAQTDPGSTAGSAILHRQSETGHSASVHRSMQLYERPASSLAEFNVEPPRSNGQQSLSADANFSKQQLRASYDGLTVGGASGWRSSFADRERQQAQTVQLQGRQLNAHQYETKQRPQTQLLQPLQLHEQSNAAPTVQSVAENLQNLMQRVAATLGTGTAEAAAGARNIPASDRQHSSAAQQQAMPDSSSYRPERIMQWPVEPRNISSSRSSSPVHAAPAGSSRQQQQLPQGQDSLGLELSYADNLRPHTTSSPLSSNQRQHVELVAPLNYIPRHKLIDAAVSSRPTSPLWNQMHVGQRRLHELQQEQQAMQEQLQQQRRCPSPVQQPQQHISSTNNNEGETQQQVAMGPAALAAAADAADRSVSRSGVRTRTPLIPVEDVVSAMRALQQATQQPQQAHSPGVSASTAVARSPVRGASRPATPSTSAYDAATGTTTAAAVPSPNITAAGEGPLSAPSPTAEDLSGLLAGVVNSVQGLDSMMSSLLEAARVRSPSKTGQTVTMGAGRQQAEQQQEQLPYVDDADTVNMGSVLPPARYRQVNSRSVTPDRQQQTLQGTVSGIVTQGTSANTTVAGSPKAQTPGEAVAAAAASVRQVMDQLRSSAMAAWQSNNGAADAAAAENVASPHQQQQADQWGALLRSLSPVQRNGTINQVFASSPGALKPTNFVKQATAAAAIAAVGSASSPGRLSPQRLQPQITEVVHSGKQNSATGASNAQGDAVPEALMQQLSDLESQLMTAQQQILSLQEHQKQQQQGVELDGVSSGPSAGQKQQAEWQVQYLAQQLTQLQDRLLQLLPGGGSNSSTTDAAAAATSQQHQHGLLTSEATFAVQQQLRNSLDALAAISHASSPATKPAASPPQQQTLFDRTTSPMQEQCTTDNRSPAQQRRQNNAVTAAATTSTRSTGSLNGSPTIANGAKRSLISSFSAGSPLSTSKAGRTTGAVLQAGCTEPAGPAAAVVAVQQDLGSRAVSASGTGAGVVHGAAFFSQDGQNVAEHSLQQTAAIAASQAVSPAPSSNGYQQQQQHGQQQQQQAALQLELLQASAEAQLVMTQQVNELHAGLNAATAGVQNLQQRLQVLELQQQELQLQQQQGQLPNEQLLLLAQAQQDQVQELQEQLQQLQDQMHQQQQQHSSNNSNDKNAQAEQQLAVLQQLQNQVQELQQQQAATTANIETQAAALAKAAAAAAAVAATEQQLAPVRTQLQQLDAQQQELLAGSKEAVLLEKGVQGKLSALESHFAQQQDVVEALQQQLAAVQQQQQHSAAENEQQQQQQQQQRLLLQTVEQLQQQLGELQQQWQEQQQQQARDTSVAAAAAAGIAEAKAAAAAAAAAADAAESLREHVQQLELKVAQLQVQQQQQDSGNTAGMADSGSMHEELKQQLQSVQQQLHEVSSTVQQLQQQPPLTAASQQITTAAAAAAECDGLRQQLQHLEQRVGDMSRQLQDCSTAAAITLPLRMSEVEERVAATAQTCADAVKVIALKHTAISAMFAEVQASQVAADNRLAQLSKQLSSIRASRGSRNNSRPNSRTISSSDVM